MRTIYYLKLALFVVLITVAGSAFVSTICYAETNDNTVSFEETVYYDIWCNALGVWSPAGAPGSYVSFYCSKNYSIDPERKLTDVKVELLKPERTYKWYNMCVPQGTIETLSFNSTRVLFNVGAFLNPIHEPVQLLRFTSPTLVLNGYRYYFNVKITLIYDSEESEEGSTHSAFYIADADLFAPDTVYQGHRTLLQDISGFSLGNNFYTAYSFYKNGYGSNSYSQVSGPGNVIFSRCEESSAGYYSDRIATFDTPGIYKIKLIASVKYGMTSIDTERITVLPVPKVNCSVTGAKTSMLKQELNITEALNPGAEMEKTEVTIEAIDSKEILSLEIDTNGKCITTGNTDTIKTRDLKIISESDEFVRLKLDFITKNKNESDYKITVMVIDSDGNTDTDTSVLTVSGANEFKPIISGNDISTREENSNISNIKLCDVTNYDGLEVERKWEYYDGSKWTDDFPCTDTSLGSGRSVIAQKTGVGKAKYRLTVKPVYNEGNSLPEFINNADRGGGTTVFETEVINVKPYVSLKSSSTIEANLILLYEEGKEAEALAQKEHLTSTLAQKGFSGNVTLRKVIGNASSSNHYGSFKVISTPFSYNAQKYSYDGENYITDSKRYYQVEATYGSYGGGLAKNEPEPKAPYYIKAYNLESGAAEWSTVVPSSTFELGNTFTLSQDDREEYLFISNASSTLVVNKTDGVIIRTISASVGNVYNLGTHLISVRSDSIKIINLSTGKHETIFTGSISGNSEMIKGLIHFAVIENSKLTRKTLDPESMKIENVCDNLGSKDCVNLSLDSRGYILVGTPSSGSTIKTRNSTSSNVGTLTLYNESGSMIKQINTGNFVTRCQVIKDADNTIKYCIGSHNSLIAVSENKRMKYYYTNNFKAFSFGTETNYPYLYAKQRDSYISTQLVTLGYCTDVGFDFYSASCHGYAWSSGLIFDNSLVSCKFTYNKNSDSFSYSNGVDFSSDYTRDYDSGYQGENSGSLQYTYGAAVNDGVSGSVSAFAPYYKTFETLVKNDLNRYLRIDNNSNTGIFIMSDYDVSLTDTGKNKFYNVDNGNELRASVNDYLSYLSSKLGGNSDGTRLIFDKGETVNIYGEYFDYEGDPSKKSCYVYYHYPYNDGANPQVNYIIDEGFNIMSTQNKSSLSTPINSFNYDGMYKVEHWQYDSTGDEAYDSKSNVATLVFFIRSGKTEVLPSVDTISISPSAPRAGQDVNAEITVSDSLSAVLTCKAEVYKDGEKVNEHSFLNIKPVYPTLSFTAINEAEEGSYTIICRITDGKRQNIKSFDFSVLPGYKVTSAVSHTLQWDTNRIRYNQCLFGNNGLINKDFKIYCEEKSPRLRPSNVFWSEEKLNIRAFIPGNPVRVNTQINGTLFCSVLSKTGQTDENGNSIYEGYLWSSDFSKSFGKSTPVEVTISVIAYYEDGTSAKSEEKIIFDDSDSYWRVHKLY